MNFRDACFGIGVGVLSMVSALSADDTNPGPVAPDGYYQEESDTSAGVTALEGDEQVKTRGIEPNIHLREGDGFRVYFDTDYFGPGYDSLIFEKLDNQHTPPDNGASGMAFTYQRFDNKQTEQIMSLRGKTVQIGPKGKMGGALGHEYSTLGVWNSNTGSGWTSQAARITSHGQWATMHVENLGPGQVLWLENFGRGDFLVAHDESKHQTVFWVDQNHVTNAKVLQIHGGADLAEEFEVAGAEEDIPSAEPGTVVSISPVGDGQLLVSTKAYDRAVAGVVSGAGGLGAGMLLGVQEERNDKSQPVALSGRVHVRCDISSGVIRPGDLLTTSARAGHCMKVMDQQLGQGAILGKALSALDDETGLVLTLVSLQ